VPSKEGSVKGEGLIAFGARGSAFGESRRDALENGRDELMLVRVLYFRTTVLLHSQRGNAAATLSDEQELIPTAKRQPPTAKPPNRQRADRRTL
jgi:hypothetical protein